MMNRILPSLAGYTLDDFESHLELDSPPTVIRGCYLIEVMGYLSKGYTSEQLFH